MRTDINQQYRTLRPQLLMYMVIGYCKWIWDWIKVI